jgi:thiol-disulfide isomerase/thioredoxin
MNTYTPPSSVKGWTTFSFWIVGLSLFTAFFLSIFSWWQICIELCSTHKEWRLFGLPFAPIGIAFFSVLLGAHVLSRWVPSLVVWVKWAIAGALGAEVTFIHVQHNQIGSWCPVCLSIALCLVIAGMVIVVNDSKNLVASIQTHNRGEMMNILKKGFMFFLFFMLGFFITSNSVSKVNAAEAAMLEMKNRLVFGNKESPVELYFITDWYCPSCKRVEPIIAQLYPEIKSKVAFYFIDYAIHNKSLNYSPYNLAFLIHNKPQYFEARHLLQNLSEKTESPSDREVMQAAEKLDIDFKELTYIDIKAGLEFFEKVEKDYKVNSTPTVVVTNPKKKKVVKLEGANSITKEKILQAIDSVKS